MAAAWGGGAVATVDAADDAHGRPRAAEGWAGANRASDYLMATRTPSEKRAFALGRG